MDSKQALKALFASFPMQDKADPEAAAMAYAFAIDGVKPDAVADAVKRFIRGEVPTHDGRFMPTPAELAKEARARAEIAHYVALAEQRQTKALPKPEPEFSDEHRRMMRDKLRSLSASLSTAH